MTHEVTMEIEHQRQGGTRSCEVPKEEISVASYEPME